MKRTVLPVLSAVSCAWLPLAPVPVTAATTQPGAILLAAEASYSERLAAHEVRRYTWLRTGKWLPISSAQDSLLRGHDVIVVARKDRPAARALAEAAGLSTRLDALPTQAYWLKTLSPSGEQVTLITGGDDAGTLYGAYRLAEILGVRFYLDGDVVPDERIKWRLPFVDEQQAPLFALRGIQPFHDFPEGPDWWNTEEYCAILGQLPKLRMNFIGLHTYPEGGPNAEPTVWIGQPADIGGGGRVNFSYPSSYQNTLRGNWGYSPKKTSEYSFGAANLFERDDFGAEAMRGYMPHPATVEGCNAVFDRTAVMLRTVFEEAHRLGIKTCVGTETPLIIPKLLRERLQSQGKNPDDSAVIEELYEGIFRRITQAYPLDYYWFWTPEGWTWEGTKWDQVARTTNDLSAAISAHRKIQPPFALATCGWVLGPQQDRTLFDKVLPKDVTVSCINREVGKTPIDKGFAEVSGRGKWAIPWLEDDGGLSAPELWAGRMRRDAFDARRYGCDGLMGIHWRTRVLGPAVSALAQAAWVQSESTLDEFYRDWSQSQFGREVGRLAAPIFTRLDGHLPRPAEWVDGPGGIRPDPRAWDVVAKDYEFVEEFATLEHLVSGRGNRERFDYWVNTFRYMRAMAEVRCAWARYNDTFARVKAEKDPSRQKMLARTAALPLRTQIVALTAEVYRHLLALVGNTGEMGTVMNWESHILPDLLTKPGKELAAALGEPLPADAQPSKSYRGPTRIIVPTVRGSIHYGNDFHVKVIILSEHQVQQTELYWRLMGQGSFASLPLAHVARGVYSATLPSKAITTDFEYYVRVKPDGEPKAFFPATAPRLNQTVLATD